MYQTSNNPHTSPLIENTNTSGLYRVNSPSPYPVTMTREIRDTLGQRIAALIRTARHRRQWSQQRLSEEAGVDRQTIIRYESGRSQTPDPVQFRKVCKALGISSIDAAIALGFITREEVNQSISLSPDLAEIVDVFTDPRIPASEKRYILEYLLWRRDRSRSTTPHTSDDHQRRESSVG